MKKIFLYQLLIIGLTIANNINSAAKITDGHNSELEQELFKAIRSLDVIKVESLIASGVNVNSFDGLKNTPIEYAADAGHTENIEIVKLLLAAKADVNYSPIKKKNQALYYAASNGRNEIAQLLLDHNADVNTSTNDSEEGLPGLTALMIAAYYGHIEIMLMLINNGANIDITHWHRGNSALIEAAQGGQVKSVKLLLELGANFDGKNSDTNSALDIAQGNSDTPYITEKKRDLYEFNKKFRDLSSELKIYMLDVLSKEENLLKNRKEIAALLIAEPTRRNMAVERYLNELYKIIATKITGIPAVLIPLITAFNPVTYKDLVNLKETSFIKID